MKNLSKILCWLLALAMLAAERASEERFDDLYQAELIYIRKSEAEVQWEARQQNQNS